jgi:hypothetical protein
MTRTDTLCLWLAQHVLPRRLVYWCGIELWAATTAGDPRPTPNRDLGIHEVLRRYEEKYFDRRDPPRNLAE